MARAAQEEADRQAGERLVSLLDQAGKAEVDDLLERGEVIYAIKRVRELTGLRLIDAKRLVGPLRHRPVGPWWQMARSTRHGFSFGALGLFIGLGALGLFLATPARYWYWLLFAVIWIPLGCAHLASAVALRRRHRSNDAECPDGAGTSPSSR